jgi:hypothetical protein
MSPQPVPIIFQNIQNTSSYTDNYMIILSFISNNTSFRQKHPAVPDDSDTTDAISYPLTENDTLPIAHVTGRVAYLPPLLCTPIVVKYTHHQNDRCDTLSAQAPVMLSRFTQCLAMFMLFSGSVPHFTFPLLLYFGCHTLPIYGLLWEGVTYYNSVFASDTSLAIAFASP